MKLTKKQQNEIKCLDYFALEISQYPSIYCKLEIDDFLDVEKEYFDITQDGKKQIKTNARLEQLLDAKKWRLRNMDMYEQGIRDIGYFTLLGLEPDLKKIKVKGKWKWKETKPTPVPKSVIEFIAKTMFKGIDKETIKELYSEEIKEIEEKFKK